MYQLLYCMPTTGSIKDSNMFCINLDRSIAKFPQLDKVSTPKLLVSLVLKNLASIDSQVLSLSVNLMLW